jgi:hypothetical protein
LVQLERREREALVRQVLLERQEAALEGSERAEREGEDGCGGEKDEREDVKRERERIETRY